MSVSRKRRRRDQRDPQPSPMTLTERDKAIVHAVYVFRVLRQDQLQALFFGSQSAAQRRLAQLFHHGYLARQFLPVRGGLMNSPILYLLAQRGKELLRVEMGIEDAQWQRSHNRIGYQFLEHSLCINDFRIAVILACQRLGYAVLAWHSESTIKQDYDRVYVPGRGRAAPVVPDSYFVLQTPVGRASFFLELDRGTMTTKRFRAKVEAFRAYYASGAYERRYGTRGLRVLTVTLSQARLANLKAATEEARADKWFWFSILDDVTPETVLDMPVWYVAGTSRRDQLIRIP